LQAEASFLAETAVPATYAVLARVSPGYPPLPGRLPTCYSPVRRSPVAEATFAHDLHVLSTPPAFILSQDQTLQFRSFSARDRLRTPDSSFRFGIFQLDPAEAEREREVQSLTLPLFSFQRTGAFWRPPVKANADSTTASGACQPLLAADSKELWMLPAAVREPLWALGGVATCRGTCPKARRGGSDSSERRERIALSTTGRNGGLFPSTRPPSRCSPWLTTGGPFAAQNRSRPGSIPARNLLPRLPSKNPLGALRRRRRCRVRGGEI
jgi:hypothetical protein